MSLLINNRLKSYQYTDLKEDDPSTSAKGNIATTNKTANYLNRKDLEELLSEHWGQDIKIHDYKVWPLTHPGDNYSSTMLAIEATLHQTLLIPSTISIVAKLLPPTKFLREVINIDITFRKEVNAYILVFPEFEQVQLEKGIPQSEIYNCFPKFYGGRINATGDMNAKADEKAILLLENLKDSGYRTGNRRCGLDYKHMMLGVAQLGRFHSLSVALKILKPDIFNQTVIKASEPFKIASQVDDTGLPKWITSTMSYVKAIPECKEYLPRIESALLEFVTNPAKPKEPYAAFIHNDFWVNNMMFKYQQESLDSPTAIKFVDFQLTQYSSPAKDLIFFIYTSAIKDVIDNHYEDLVQVYSYEFNNCLKKLGISTELFSLQSLKEEINTFGPTEFAHILMMLKFICADGDKLPDLSNNNIEELLEINTGGEVYANRVTHLVQNFIQKGWL